MNRTPTRSASTAMMQWYLRRMWRLSVLVALALALGPWLFARVIGLSMDLSAPENVAYCLQYSVLALICLGSCVWMPLEEFERLHRALPVSSARLARLLLLAPATAMLLLNLISLSIYRWLFSAQWPVFGLSISLAVLVVQLSAGYYSLHRFAWWKLLGWLSFVVAFVVWTAEHFFPDGFHKPIALWQSSRWDVVVWAGAATVAFLLGAAAYVHVRCQNSRSSVLLYWIKRQPHELLAGSPKIQHLRDSNHSLRVLINTTFLPTGLSSGVSMSLVFAAYVALGISGARAGDPFGELSTVLSVTFITTCGCLGLLHGTWTGTEHWGYPGKKKGQGQFLLTLPFSTRDLAHIITRCLATSLVLGVAVMFAIVSAGACVCYFFNVFPLQWTAQLPASSEFASQAVFISAQSLALAWLAASIAYGLAALQRPVWVTIALTMTYGAMLLFAVLQHYVPQWRPAAVVLTAAVIAVLAGSFLMFAARATLTRRANLVFAVMAAAILSAVSWALPYTGAVRVLCGALALLAVATPSLIAVAMDLNRHR